MNIRWFALILMLALIPGCSGEIIETTPSEALYETKPTDAVGFSYVCGSAVESADDALTVWAFPDAHGYGLTVFGSDLLLFSGTETTTLTLLSAKNCRVKAQRTLPCLISPDDPGVSISGETVTYTDREAGQLVFLDRTLEEYRRVELPEDCGAAYISEDQQTLYYCSNDALQALDLATGISKTIRSLQGASLELTDLLCGDSILQCRTTRPEEGICTLFFSGKTGRLLYELTGEITLWTCADLYVTARQDGAYQELLVGSVHYGPSVLVPAEAYHGFQPLPQQRRMLLYSQTKDGCIQVDCYDLDSGLRTARLQLPAGYEIADVCGDCAAQTIRFLCRNSERSQMLICQWEVKGSSVCDEAVYLRDRESAEEPDLQGLEYCRYLAARISILQDVEVLVWTDATQFQPSDNELTAEYQVSLIQSKLTELDAALSLYPSGFLDRAARQTGSGRLNICLVRQIDGITESRGGLLFWGADTDAYLAITADGNMTRQLHQLLYLIIDSRILGNCNAFDQWNRLNPKDFQYGDPSSVRAEYLSGETGYFIDEDSMTSPVADRARIMECAMADNCADCFVSPHMQAKLRQLCIGIRAVFPPDEPETVYPWEQYLQIPIA